MTKRRYLLLIVAILFLSPLRASAVSNGEIKDLKQEIDNLKTKVELLEAQNEDTTSRIGNLVDISGYADGEFNLTDNQAANARSEFRLHHLSLFFSKQLAEQWRLFSEVEFEDAPKIEPSEQTYPGEIFVEVFTLEYSHNRYVNFRLGRFLNPAGIWNVEHYPPFVLTQEQPTLVTQLIFPHTNDGLQFYGSHYQGGVTTDYLFYVSNGSGENPGHGDINTDKSWGADLGFKLPFLSDAEIGFSYDRENRDENDNKVKILGADARLAWQDLKFQGEYAKRYTRLVAGTTEQTIGWYSQLTYDWRKWTVGYRYDWYDPDQRENNNRMTTNTVALNYHFTPNVVGKIEHHFVKDEGASDVHYTKTLFSVAVYLGGN
ncbi:MAG: porin [Deltaproteobacteria bacterium]|nr:porin [Deltaproteobacteria bacterium]